MASQSQQGKGVPTGFLRPSSTWGDVNNLLFMIQQEIGKMQTALPVRVDACSNDGGLSPVGTVDITIMVNQLDGAGLPTEHVTIYNVPYVRLQGGTNAVIIDPNPGDIGIALFASRDISKIKATRAAGNPGSYRQYSFSDAIYIGGMLNGTPSQYVRFNSAGINLTSPTKISLNAPTVEINADDVAITSSTLTHNGVNIGATHEHGNVEPGSGNTGPPE